MTNLTKKTPKETPVDKTAIALSELQQTNEELKAIITQMSADLASLKKANDWHGWLKDVANSSSVLKTWRVLLHSPLIK